MAERLPQQRSESAFEDFKGAYTEGQAVVEANRCFFCSGAPCIDACPTHIDIPQFIRKIATGNVKGSAKTIFESNILGMSCARVCPVEVLCVGACVYNDLGLPPIQIGKLQRHSTDVAFEKKWRFFEAGKPSGKSVALVGAGPASLSCAHELRRFGHACTIYEMRPVIGGLNTTGVAPYKMKADRSLEEVEWVLGIGGIDVKTGVAVGRDISFAELENAHDAVFIGVGLGPDTRLGVPGEELPGVFGAVDFIEQMKLGKAPVAACASAVIVGGGNTAIDAVREALGLGLSPVTLVYRGIESGMSGYLHEWRAAQNEGASAAWRTLPVAFEGDGKLERVRCVRVDDQKQPIAGSEFVLDAQVALVAIGQSKLTQALGALGGIELDKGRVVADDAGRTGRKGFFVGGDCKNGGKEVVNAVAEGQAAAWAIEEFLLSHGGE